MNTEYERIEPVDRKVLFRLDKNFWSGSKAEMVQDLGYAKMAWFGRNPKATGKILVTIMPLY